MKIWLTVILLIINSVAFAVTGEEFCQSYIEITTKNKAPTKTKTIFTVLFNPKKIIQASSLGEDPGHSIKTPKTNIQKIVFINMPQFDLDHNEELDELKRLQKENEKSPLLKKVKKVHTVGECLQEIKKDNQEFARINHFLEEYESKKELIDQDKQRAMNTQIEKKLRVFKKNDWKVVYSKNLFDFYQFINANQKISEIMMISHSDELGRLYDAEKNIFPKKGFGNLPRNITKVIMFSCHSRKVADYYSLTESIQHFDYYFPEVTDDFKEIFEDKIPVLAIKGMLKSAKAQSRKQSSDTACVLEISLPVRKSNLIVTLNNEFIGTFQNEEEFNQGVDCKKISQGSNQVKIYYLGSKSKDPLGVLRIVLKNQNNRETNLQIKEYLSSNGHGHILTIGNTGGIL